jgi:hypothetical protein
MLNLPWGRFQTCRVRTRCLNDLGMIGILAMPSGVETTAAEPKGTGEGAYSTLIQKHLPGDVSRPFALRPIPDSFCAAPFSGQNPETV